jgi:hypothetical protein
MIYSSSKGSILSMIEKDTGIMIDKKVRLIEGMNSFYVS